MNNDDYEKTIKLLFFKYNDSTKNNLLKFLRKYLSREIDLDF